MTLDPSLRGKCKERSEAAIAADPTLQLVRGWYHCPIWGKEEHWWTVREDGAIFDPTASQFPSGGLGEYEEYKGIITCEQCGKQSPEAEAHFYGRYAYCSSTCVYKNVM